MTAHNIIMAVLAVIAFLLIFLAPGWNVGRGYGFLLLLCPLMMLAMMRGMKGHDK